ncbi:phosphatidylserine decarboxylase proenzyme, mitochondrial-like [Ylistrum balloti]|uniref:phosphatidylserine decarboxylase proenzyme, mitochondrial-like n=1 Tax=Ylistrum balloti TaxID=509963 RepID=UPI002905E181|nr:phosphatidylserine decarboxylase proenzyme, mitochondrial-like [Ylistrum balloti]
MATSMMYRVRPSSGVVLHRWLLTQCPTRPAGCGNVVQVFHRSWSETVYQPKKRGWWLKYLVFSVAVGGGVAVYRPHTFNKQVENAYKKLPLAVVSRLFGRLSKIELPEKLREPVLGFYVRMFNVDLSEAADEDLTHYSSVGEFFRRPLKPDARPVDELHDLTCPSDGKVLHFGVVQDGKLEQVKGITYSLRQFLGHTSWLNGPLAENVHFMSDEEFYKSLHIQPGNDLYYCIIYLAPGNYHRFHSAVDWTIKFRRHFPGKLLSVSPWVAERVKDLFNYNERVVYLGTWKHGLFSYIPVGATNVGSIKIYRDEELATNRSENKRKESIDKSFSDGESDGMVVKKGEVFGEFNMGSTVVLVFEAPKDFQFTCNNGQQVKCGIALGNDKKLTVENEHQKIKS